MGNQTEICVDPATPLAEYLASKAQLSRPLATAEQLERLIAGKREEVARTRAAIPGLSTLVSKREDLLAERAIGGTVDADITAIDAEIARIEEIAAAAENAIATEEQAIAGLQRRLDGVNQEIAELTADGRENALIAAVLKDHAEVLSREYTLMANQMKNLVLRLMAVDKLFLKYTDKHLGCDGRGPFDWDFSIAICRLDDVTPHEGRNCPGPYRLFAVRSVETHEWDAAMKAEREALAERGMKW